MEEKLAQERRGIALGLEMPGLNGKVGSQVTWSEVTEASLSEKNAVFLKQTIGKEFPPINSLQGKP